MGVGRWQLQLRKVLPTSAFIFIAGGYFASSRGCWRGAVPVCPWRRPCLPARASPAIASRGTAQFCVEGRRIFQTAPQASSGSEQPSSPAAQSRQARYAASVRCWLAGLAAGPQWISGPRLCFVRTEYSVRICNRVHARRVLRCPGFVGIKLKHSGCTEYSYISACTEYHVVVCSARGLATVVAGTAPSTRQIPMSVSRGGAGLPGQSFRSSHIICT